MINHMIINRSISGNTSTTNKIAVNSSIQTRYNASALHTSSRTDRKRQYHNMNSLQSEKSNFDHQKVYSLLKNSIPENLHPKMYLCANFHVNRTHIFSRIAGTDVRTYVTHRPCN